MTIPSLGIAKLPHYKICQNKTQILLGLGEDLLGMQLINEGINMCALPALLKFEENRSWRMCIGNQEIKISRCLIHWLGMFGSSSIYLKLNLKSPYIRMEVNIIQNFMLLQGYMDFWSFQWNHTLVVQSVTSWEIL